MLGYIISINKCKNEDLIVKILTNEKILTLYRFYGARHSTINLGYKIDFSVEQDKIYMPRLRNILHISYGWLFQAQRVFFWQEYIRLLNKHLFDVEDLGGGYFALLEDLAQKISTLNPIRAIIENYLHLLELEGRLNTNFRCFICNEPIKDGAIGISRAFLPSHRSCLNSSLALSHQEALDLFLNKKTIFLSDQKCLELYVLIKQGL